MRRDANSFPSKRRLLLAAVLGGALATLPAIASSESLPVEAVNEGGGVYGETHRWSNVPQAIGAGEAVRFVNSTEVPHGVEWRGAVKPVCEEGPGKVPVGSTPSAAGTHWSGNCTFSQAGSYLFYCTVHGAAMRGTITVNATTTTTTTTTNTTTGGAPPPTTSTTPPPSGEPSSPQGPAFKAVQLAKSQRGSTVRGSIDLAEAADGGRLEVDVFAQSAAVAKTKHASVTVGRRLFSQLSAGRLPISVALNAKARRALKRRRRLSLRVKITLTQANGQALSITRTVVQHV